MYDQKAGEFKLRAGPLFSNILLADEINRAPPKTQAALLEAMEEKQVTIEGITHKLPAPFVVIATQNPIEQEGTYLSSFSQAQNGRAAYRALCSHYQGSTYFDLLKQRQIP